MKRPRGTYPLRLPHSVKAEVERRAAADGISINQFVATAVGPQQLHAVWTAVRAVSLDVIEATRAGGPRHEGLR